MARRHPLPLRFVALVVVVGALLLTFNVLIAWRELAADLMTRRPITTAHLRLSVADADESAAARALMEVAQRFAEPRGVVMPVYDQTVLLALSLVLELRDMGIDLPVELPYCGDVDTKEQSRLAEYAPLGDVRFYDVCERALNATIADETRAPLFCADMAECEAKFRGFEVKPLALAFSQFEEVMLMDADTIFFQNPVELFDSAKFQTTGTLFFHDRAAHELYFLDQRLNDGTDNSVYHKFMSEFHVAPFRDIPTLERPRATVPNPVDLELPFEPSDFLLKSNVWNKLTGHQMDSSLVFWSKKKQPRATAILASFVSAAGFPKPPSYGDKEFFFTACELAETQYSFSDFGISGFGDEYYDHGENKSMVCGRMAQVYPIKPNDSSVDVPLMYANSDFILTYNPKDEAKPYYYVKGRPADFYPGPYGELRLECPFNVTGVRINEREENHILLRQRFHHDLEVLRHAQSLAVVTQRTPKKRGIVIPMYDPIVLLGLSLVLELRDMGIDLPVEIPHCGDVDQKAQLAFQVYHRLGDIRFYDVCELAASVTVIDDPSTKLFCADRAECEKKFRGFEVKVAAIAFSQFEEIMLMDADTIFFQNPAELFESEKFQTTGTLFMHDRAAHEIYYLAQPLNDGTDNRLYHKFMSEFHVAPFRAIPTLERPKATVPNPVNLTLPFEPSDFLLKSNVWNKLTGHQMDSSLVFWSKKKQPRATAILASFVSTVGFTKPFSYGDKEFFFTACELAETQYAFSDFGISGLGDEYYDHGEDKSMVCGRMAQVYPIKPKDPKVEVPLFYANSDFILTYNPKDQDKPYYYAKGRPAEFYPGPFGELRMECPFNVTGVRITEAEENHMLLRQQFHQELLAWEHALTFSMATQRTSKPRGIVIPMYDRIVMLGLSLIVELRDMGIDLPVEIPHCGDIDPKVQELYLAYEPLGEIRFYDVCELALNEKNIVDSTTSMFCADRAECEKKFRGFEVKIVSVVYSQFEEIMLMDADTIFFQNPAELFESEKFQTTGTLFMHDRAAHEIYYLAQQLKDGTDNRAFHKFMSEFHVAPFRAIPTLERPKATVPNPVNLTLPFEPSDFLLKSNVWNKLTGHQMDSSLVFWSKKKQPRATAILASFVSAVGFPRPPSYGDKEFFFTACELAETQYAFSDFGISGFGDEFHDHGEDKSMVCGRMAQVYPIKPKDPKVEVPLFYANSDFILTYNPKDAAKPYYYAKGRPADFYPGPFGELRMECPFNVTGVRITAEEENHILLRQQFNRDLKGWKMAFTLAGVTQQQTSEKRGIVMPLYNPVLFLGLSLILELRDMGVDLPVEIPHCGELDSEVQSTFNAYKALGGIRFYDVCDLAVNAVVADDPSIKLFCADRAECEKKFRGFDIKIISVAFSKFEEIMLMDADTIFFQNPAELFESEKFQTTGTLFMHDRAAHEIYYMSERLKDGTDNTVYHKFMSEFHVTPFKSIPTLERPKPTLPNPVNLTLPFEPSDFLLSSNVWNKRTGHQMDSSLVFWSKKKQPRATAILASFVSSVGFTKVPSYGDKELFFTACELAETQYSFSDFGLSGFGDEFHDHGEDKSMVCGRMAQVYPIKPKDSSTDARLMYANSDFILTYNPKDAAKPYYYAKGRPADFYPGPFGELRMECPFNVTGVRITEEEEDHILLRQQFNKDLEIWQAAVKKLSQVEKKDDNHDTQR